MAMACVLQNGCRHTPSEALCLSRKPSFDRGQNSGFMVVSMRTCTYPINPVQPVLHSGWNCTNYFHIFYSKSSFQPFLILFFSSLSRAFFFPIFFFVFLLSEIAWVSRFYCKTGVCVGISVHCLCSDSCYVWDSLPMSRSVSHLQPFSILLTYSSYKITNEEQSRDLALQSTFSAPDQYHRVWEDKK